MTAKSDTEKRPPRQRSRRKRAKTEYKWGFAKDKVREHLYLSRNGWRAIQRGMRFRHYQSLTDLVEAIARKWSAEDVDRLVPVEETILHMVRHGVQKRQQLQEEMGISRAELDTWVDGLIARDELEEVLEKASSEATRGFERQKILILPGAATGDRYSETVGESGLAALEREA